MRSEKGFTLLEIIITLTVITLVLAVSYPSLSRGTTALSLRTTSRDILSILRYAREKAVTEQTEMRVVVDQDNQSVLMINDIENSTRTYSLPENVKIHGVVLEGVRSGSGVSSVRFLPNGSSNAVEILIESRAGAFMKIVSDPITGVASIRPVSEEDLL
jgi:prepilin-type N-terminal cleavage/methylation domain-containing protein